MPRIFAVRWCGKSAGMLAPFKDFTCRMAAKRPASRSSYFVYVALGARAARSANKKAIISVTIQVLCSPCLEKAHYASTFGQFRPFHRNSLSTPLGTPFPDTTCSKSDRGSEQLLTSFLKEDTVIMNYALCVAVPDRLGLEVDSHDTQT